MIVKMSKNEILSILEDWNLWRKDIDAGFERPTYLAKLRSFVDTNQVVVITGPRRAGKSFLMRQLAKDLANRARKENVLFVNFEDPRFTRLDTGLLNEIYETYL